MIFDKIIIARKKLIEYTLLKAKFIQITGHWIYLPILSNKPVVFDLGGNLGNFSTEMKERFASNNYLFEPNASLCEKINDDIASVYNVAVSSKCGEAEFLLSNNHEASSFNFGNVITWGLESKQTVKTIDWTEMLRITNCNQSVIDLIKIDIEGSEIDFLNSLTDTDLSKIKSITVEFHDWLDTSLHESTINTIKRLKKNNFLTVTDAPNHNWPVEMCFINKRFLTSNRIRNIYFNIYQLIKF